MDKVSNTSLVGRMNEFLNRRGISRAQFADTCGILRSTVTQILSGRNKKIGNDIINAIHEAYPELSIGWLLFGEGVMFENSLGEQPLENSLFEAEKDVARENTTDEASQAVAVTDNQPIIRHLNSNKTVSKIVIFYSDNSFEEFFSK